MKNIFDLWLKRGKKSNVIILKQYFRKREPSNPSGPDDSLRKKDYNASKRAVLVK